MRIGRQIGLLIGLLLFLLVIAGGAGFYGTHILSSTLAYLAGPAWDTADDAMEGSIFIELEMLIINDLMDGIDPEQQKEKLGEARQESTIALQRMKDAGLIEEKRLRMLAKREDTYRAAEKVLLTRHDTYVDGRDRYDDHVQRFVAYNEFLEAEGDKAMEALERAPNRQTSWNGGLRARWQAADGGMEASIGLLTQLYYLARMEAGDDPQACQKEIEDALVFHENSFSEMLASGRFDFVLEEGENTWNGAGKTAADHYRSMFEDHRKLMQEYIGVFIARQEAVRAYNDQAKEMRGFLEDLEEQADQTVEGQIDAISGDVRRVYGSLGSILLVSLIICLVFGIMLTRSITNPIQRAADYMAMLAQGDFSQSLESDRQDEIGTMVRSLNEMARQLSEVFQTVFTSATGISQRGKDLRELSDRMATTVGQLTERASTMSVSSEEMSENMGTISSTSDNASEAIQMIATGTDQLSAASVEIASSASSVQMMAGEALSSAEHAGEQMHALSQSAENIGAIVSLIEEIAGQTRLLALNATIEAARAGTYGRGFAVVAGEVKSLASQTNEAAQDIYERVQGMQSHTGDAVERMKTVSEAVVRVEGAVGSISAAAEEQSASNKDIASHIQRTASGFADINTSIHEATSGTIRINRDISEMSEATGGIGDASQQLSNLSKELSEMGHGLEELLQRFEFAGGTRQG